jgi:RNA polymerase sigma factor (sigma-70 family)
MLRHLHRLAGAPEEDDLTDGQLLERFRTDRDEAAFTALVRRHGPMVLAACRRLLPRAHDAEDAFQAAFFILARKAGSIRSGESVAGYLYGVACRVALRARGREARRRERERRAAAMVREEPVDPLTLQELRAVLDEELGRLPEKYRVPLVLCYLEGQTHEQAARELGCPRTSLSSRVVRARGLLRQRLARRGLVLTAGLLAESLGEASAPAAVPVPLLRAAVRAGALAASGRVGAAGLVSPRAVALARDAVRATGTARLQLLAGVLLGIGLACAGVVLLQQSQAAALPEPAPGTTRPQASGGQAQRTDRLSDALPAGVLARLGTLRLRQGYELRAVTFGPGDRTVLSAGSDRTIHVWDAATGKEVSRLTGHQGRVNALALSPDGKQIASASDDRTVRLWDPATGKEVRRLEGHAGPVVRVAFAPDGTSLASAGADRSVRLWDTGSGRQVGRLTAPGPLVRSLAFSPDGKTLGCGASTSTDNSTQPRIVLWDLASGKELRTLDGYSCHAFTREGQSLVTLAPRHLRLWDTVTWQRRLDLPATVWGKDRATLLSKSVEFDPPVMVAPDRRTVAAVTRESSDQVWACQVVRVWDLQSGKERFTAGRTRYGIDALAFSGDGKTLAVGPANGTLRLFDVATGKERLAMGHGEAVRRVAFTPDGKGIVTGSEDGTSRLWDAATGAERRRFDHNDMVMDSALSPDGRTLVVGCGATANTPLEALFVWDLTTGRSRGRFRLETGHGAPFLRYSAVHAVAFAPDGKTFALAGFDRKVRVWDAASLEERRRFPSGENVFSLCFSPDGRTLAGNGDKGEVILWDWQAGHAVRQLTGHAGSVSAQAFSPDGRLLAAADDRGVRLWETATGRQRLRLTAKLGSPRAFAFDRSAFVAFSPAGRWLATGGDGSRFVTIWDAATGREAHRWSAHERGVVAAAFAPDGRRLATASDDTTVLVWDLSGRLKTAADRLPEAGREGLWAALAEEDAARAQRAMGQLAAAGDGGVTFLGERLKPATWDAGQAGRAQQLIADLDSDTFAVREKATQALRELGGLAEPALREALQGVPKPEVRRRAGAVLDGLKNGSLTAAQLREVRAVEVLERVGTPEARRLLEALAQGAAAARLTREAQASLARLAKRPPAER